jgi:hypothetical protein
MPIPAEPAFTTRREGSIAEVIPSLPTTTVFTVPAAGATRGWKFAGSVPAKRGTVSQLLYPPGCHIQPIPGTDIQLP